MILLHTLLHHYKFLINFFHLTSNFFNLGITKVFLRDGVLEILNEAKNQWHLNRANAAAKIQSIVSIQAKERHANGSTVVEISIPPSLFQT